MMWFSVTLMKKVHVPDNAYNLRIETCRKSAQIVELFYACSVKYVCRKLHDIYT